MRRLLPAVAALGLLVCQGTAEASPQPRIGRVAAVTFDNRADPLTVSAETTATVRRALICVEGHCRQARHLGPGPTGEVFTAVFRLRGLHPGKRVSYRVAVSGGGHAARSGQLRVVLVP